LQENNDNIKTEEATELRWDSGSFTLVVFMGKVPWSKGQVKNMKSEFPGGHSACWA